MRIRRFLLASIALCAACGDDTPVLDDNDAPDAATDPNAPDGGGDRRDAAPTGDVDAAGPMPPGCAALVTPPPAGAAVPDALVAGAWYRCGALGSGAARVIRPAAGGSRAVVVTDAGDAFVLELPGLAAVGRFAHGTGRVSFAALSPDGALLATVNDEVGEVAIWEVATGELVRELARAPSSPSLYDLGGAAFSSDGARLAVVSGKHLDVWEVATGAALPISSRDDLWGSRVAFAAGDSRLVVARFDYWGNGPYAGWGHVDLVDADTGENQVRLAYAFHISMAAFAVSGDGTKVAVSTADGLGAVSMFDTTTGAGIPIAALTGTPLALSQDGGQVVLRGGDELAQLAGPIVVHRTSDGTVVHSLDTDTREAIAVTPNLAYALIGDLPPEVLTARAFADGEDAGVACGAGHSDQVGALAQTADGATLYEEAANLSGGHSERAWDVATGEPASVPPPEDRVGPSATSPDGQYRAQPGVEPSFDLVEVATGAVIRTFGPHESRVVGLEFSPDGGLIASSSERDPKDRRDPAFVKLWVTDTGALAQSVETHGGDATALFHTGGERLFVPGQGTVAVWCEAP
jgi:WD40 repeat protein